MRSSPTGNGTLLRIQQEIREVAERENELRSAYLNNNASSINNSEDENTDTKPVSNGHGIIQKAASADNSEISAVPTRIYHRTISSPALMHETNGTANIGTNRRFVPNKGQLGMMQKFYKMKGKVNVVAAVQSRSSMAAWTSPAPTETISPPKTVNGKPIRKGYVPVEERIQNELRDLKTREDELKTERRKSQPDLMAFLEKEDEEESSSSVTSPSPIPGKLRSAKSFTHLNEDLCDSPPPSCGMKPAKSLAELCDAADEEIESPRSLIQQWESRIKQLQENQ